MEGYSGPGCSRASEISFSVEDEAPEGLVEPQEVAELTNSLKDIIQNEEVKPKLQCVMSDPSVSTVTVQSEDSGITGENSSSRCSTPWASEASATSDLYSIGSSSVESPQGQDIFLMDESKPVRRRMCCKSSDRTVLPSGLKGGQGSKKSDMPGMQLQESRDAPTKVPDAKLDAAELQAQAMDAETSKYRKDLLHSTGESVSKPMGKENKLKKGRPALNGAVSAKIQKFNSISEETTPKFFRKKNSKDPAMPSDIKRKQKQQPKGMLNQNPSSPSLMHLKKDGPQHDGSLHNIRPAEMNIETSSFSYAGATVPLDKDERKKTQSSQAETLYETSKQSLSVSPYLTDERGNQPHPFSTTTAISRDSVNEPKGQAIQPSVPMSTESVLECPSSSQAVEETERQEIQFYSPVTTPSEPEHSVFSGTKNQDIKLYSPITVQSESELLDMSYSTYETEPQETVQLDTEYSVQHEIQPCSLLTAQSECDHPDISYSTEEAEEQEIQPYLPIIEQPKFENVDLSCRTDETETQESECCSQVSAGPEAELSELSYSIGMAEKQENSQLESEHLEMPSILTHSATTAQLDSEHLDLSLFIDEAEKQATQLEHGRHTLSHSIEEAEDEKIQPNLLVPAHTESEHLVSSETESEEIHHYSPTAPHLESGHVVLSYSTGNKEMQDSQCSSCVSEGLAAEHSFSYYSVEEVTPQEIQSYSSGAAQSMPEHLALLHSTDDEEKQDIQPCRPKHAQAKNHSLVLSCDTDEAEMGEIQLHSPEVEDLVSEQLVTKSLMHTDDKDGPELQAYSLGTEYLPSQQLTAPPTFSVESDQQEIQPDEHEVPDLVSEVLNFSAGSTIEEKHGIDSSLLDTEGMMLEQSTAFPSSCNEEADRTEKEPYLAGMEHTSSEQSMAAGLADYVDETVLQKNQSYSESFPSTQIKAALVSPFNEKKNVEVEVYSLEETDLLPGESKTVLAGSTNSNEADEQGSQSPPNDAEYFESKQFPGRLQTAHTAQCTNENKSDMTMASDFVPNEDSCNLLPESINEIHIHNSCSSVPGNPNSDTNLNNVIVTSSGVLSKAEEKQHFSEVETGSKEPEHYLPREEKLTEYVHFAEESKHTPEPDEQKDAFNIISEGYEILNIHAVPLISSVDEEESKHMPDKLEYLETNTLIKTKLSDSGGTVADQEVSASGTATEISDNSTADDIEVKDREQKIPVEEVDAHEIMKTEEEISTMSENKGDDILNPHESSTEMDYFEKYTLIDDKSPTELSTQGLGPLLAVKENPKKRTEETISSTRTSDNTLEDEFTLLDNDLDEAFYGLMEEESKVQSHADAQKFLTMQKSVNSCKEVTNIEDEQKLEGTSLFDREEGVLERSMLFPTTVSAVNPELLEEPPALAFLYKDLYAEAGGEDLKGANEPPSDEESGNSDASFPSRNSDPDDGTGMYFEKYILKDDIPCNVAESQKDQVSTAEAVNEDLSSQPRVSGDEDQESEEVIEDEHLCVHILSEESSKTEVLSEGVIVVRETNPSISYIKVTICQPTQAVPFGSKFGVPDARNVPASEREEEDESAATNQELSEQMSHEESSQVLESEETANQKEASVQDESKDDTPLTDEQNKQHEVAAVNKMDNYVPGGRTPVDESESSQYGKRALPHLHTPQQPKQLLSYQNKQLQPMMNEEYYVEHDHHESLNKKVSRGKHLLEADEQTNEKRASENIANDIAQHHLEVATTGLPESGVKFDETSDELVLQSFRSELDNLRPDSTRDEQCFGTDEDLAESMDYEVITQEELLQDEMSSELAHEDLVFENRESFEQTSYNYEFENEAEKETPTEHEDSGFVMMNSEESSLALPESESLQKEIKKAHIDTYCCQCRCPISAIDKLFGGHETHDVMILDTAVMEMKGQLDEFLGELQQRSVKIEELVSEIETLFNSVEENSKKNEQLLEDQNEEMVKAVIAQYDAKSQNFEEVKKMKMEYLYEQMVNFQQTIIAAKEALETTVKETEELDDDVFLKLSKEINKRLLSAMDNSLSLEKMPSAFSLFDHYADSSGRSDQETLKCVAVPQTPKLLPQEPNSATSTSIAVYWTVSERDVIDCFQVYCMEEPQANKDQSALVEEYRVTVKESYCILEDLEPDRCYGVWVMAVNYTGCSLPTDKSIFKTAPSTPVLKAEDCTVCWDTAVIRWSTANSEATECFTLEYCRQYSPEGEGLRSFAGIKKPELKVNLQPNVNYFFYVRAVNSSGTSEQSEAALISTKGTRFHVMSDTAHPALQVSGNGTAICLPERTNFSGLPSALGELLPARGQHYWETTATGCQVYRIGICYNSTPQCSTLGQDDTSWCMCCCSTQTSFIYKFFHCGVMSDVYMTEQPARVGILLDYNGGRLSFFNAERRLVLFTIRHKFTNPAHPAFVLETAGVLNLHTGMELPEFVKYS